MLLRKKIWLPKPVDLGFPRPGHPSKQATTVTTSGAATTASASANTKGTYTVLTASTPYDCDGFIVSILGGTASRDWLIDIAIGAAGSEVVIVPNILHSSGSGANVEATEFYVPIPIKGGTAVSARCQSQTGSAQCFVGITVVSTRFMPRFRRCTAYGATTATTRGTSVDPGGSANTLGSWVQLSAAITNPIRHAIVLLGCQNNYARTGANHTDQIGTGAASSEVVVLPGLYFAQDGASDHFRPSSFERSIEIAAGTRLAARGQSSGTDATDRLHDVMVLGFD